MLPHFYVTLRASLHFMLALALLLAGISFVPSIAAQTAAPQIELENLDQVPFNDRLVFNRINNSGLPAHNQAKLRIKNVGAAELQVAPLTISGSDAANYTLPLAADRAAFTIPAGGSRDITVRFITPDPNRDGGIRGIRNAILTLTSNDPVAPTTSVQLAGFNMIRSQGDNEPTMQEIIDTFGYATNVLNPNENQQLNPGGNRSGQCFVATGDEVISSNGRWSRADATQAVSVRQLAAFSGSGTSSISISGTGGGTVIHNDQNYQTYYPLSTNFDASGNPLPVALTLGVRANGTPISGLTNFAVSIKGQSSLRCAEDPTLKTSVRFWVARDRSGAIIPNTYIVGGDIVGSNATNYDYQDNVYLITNIKPATSADPANTPAPAIGSANLVLEFDRDDYPNTLTDNDNQRTGFPETQRNRNDISNVLEAPSSSYDRTLLNLNTGGQGTLTVRTTGGSNEGTLNTQLNALCLPFDARADRFVVTTRLIGPLDGLTTAQQQAGLLFGPNQGNFIRLTAGTQVTDPSSGMPWIQLAQEFDNVLTQVGPLVPIPALATVNTLDLQLTADPTTGEVAAAYRVNGGALVTLPNQVQIPAAALGRFFDLRARGCIVASNRSADAFDAVFDRFAITAAPAAVGLPTVSAGPDQVVRTGVSVTLQGSATDAAGALLGGDWQQVAGAPQVTLEGSGNTRTFTAPNSYSVLTFAFAASDAQNRSASDTVTITVGAAPITGLNITANTPVALGSAVRLIAGVVQGATPISYSWNFGDGTAPVVGGPVVTHTYANLGTYKVTVTATNSVGSASVSTPIQVQTPVPDFAFRYDAGSTTNVTTGGVTWRADSGLFTPTNSPAERRSTNGPPIANTEDDVLYQTYRGRDTSTGTRTLTYNIPIHSQLNLPAGTLVRANLRLHFAEIYWGGALGAPNQPGPGRRVFDIIVEGQTLIDNFDITAAAGGADRAMIIPLNGIEITDGQLTLALKAEVDYAAISAFEIVRAPEPPLENAAPVVSAGLDQEVPARTLVTLSGTGSDPEGEPLTFAWIQNPTGAPTVNLTGSGATRSFTPTEPGTYSFSVSATDSGGLTGSDVVLVFVGPAQAPENTPPTADAGADQIVALGVSVTLTGSAEDSEGGPLSSTWSQFNNAAPLVTLTGSGATRSFTPAAAGTYLFIFTVTDSGGLSATDIVAINVVQGQTQNQPPTAEAGADRIVPRGVQVTLNGTGSDPENGPLTYTWVQNGGPAVNLTGNGATLSFTPTATGSYQFTLVVTDNGGLSSADSMTITVVDNQAPNARATGPQNVQVGGSVTLDGSASSDPEGSALSYNWQQISGPAVTLQGANTAQTRFTAPAQAATLRFRLTVTDAVGITASSEIQVMVVGGPAQINNRIYLPFMRR